MYFRINSIELKIESLIIISFFIFIPTYAQDPSLDEQITKEHTEINTGLKYISDQIQSINLQATWQTYTSLILGILAVWITITIYKIQTKQSKKIKDLVSSNNDVSTEMKKLTDEVHSTVIEEALIRKGITEDISYHMNGKLDVIIRSLTHSLKMYKNFKDNKDGKKENWLEAMKSAYDRCYPQLNFQVNLLEMMKILGTPSARKYWRLLGKLQLKSEFWGDILAYEFTDFSDHIQECLEEAKLLQESLKSMLPKK